MDFLKYSQNEFKSSQSNEFLNTASINDIQNGSFREGQKKTLFSNIILWS